MKRAELYKEKPRQCINTFTEALQTVDPLKAVGKLHKLWIAFAKFYEDNEQIDDARTIFEKVWKMVFTISTKGMSFLVKSVSIYTQNQHTKIDKSWFYLE